MLIRSVTTPTNSPIPHPERPPIRPAACGPANVEADASFLTSTGDQMPDVLAITAPAAISVAGALVSVFYAHRLGRNTRIEEADRLAVRFREPMIQAAFNLQSRLYNIARLNFLGLFLTKDAATREEREYAVLNTVYLIGQYLGWVEVIRRESQYVDPRSRVRNREIVEKLEQIRETFSDSLRLTDPTLRLFRGEQRAIGEVMLRPVDSADPGLPRWECKGYGQFVEEHETESVRRWFRRLENDISVIGKDPEVHLYRLTQLQHDLVALIEVLDPDDERVPSKRRKRL
jgi:hypothetical protein